MDKFKLAVRSSASSHRLIVVSNRAPIRVIRRDSEDHIEPTVGGVGSTFLRLLERRGGCWIAWSGGQNTPQRLKLPAQNPLFDLVFIKLSEREVAEYYWSMSNRGIWPLMHFMTPNCHFNARHWTTYHKVNEAFAEVAAGEAAPGDALWIQDFHLALTPAMVRRRSSELSIGLFWHVPFPPEQIFRILPWRAEFLRGMLGSDLIGFHIPSYATHFLNCCESILGTEVDRARGIVVNGQRQVRVGAFPLGIPVDYFEGMARSEPVRERVQRLRRSLRTPHVLLGVDRLDYTKGICERILGFERFLEENAKFHRRVTLVLIAVPSRTRVADYVQLKREVDEQIGRITGRFSSEGWVPIRYLYTQFGPEELIAYYTASDIALLTPLRDGMNLVAKEYIASHPDDDGTLILSEFAGAAEELPEALLVNPYDIDQIAARIKEALTMSEEMKQTRMRALRRRVHSNNLERWSSAFLQELDEAALTRQDHATAASAHSAS
ncbi:MAG TPA: trehalose-6-phosphate synthase [Candidatus Binataceae bacterium]|nr:trehalose-6-phosphate synthase [Candidatus Binataceae bacterium]